MSDRGIFLITGGSRGIGAAIAVLAARQYPVAFFYRERSDEAGKIVQAIEQDGGSAVAIQADVGDEASLLRGFEAVDRLGRLEVLVNNAGITGGVSRLEDLSTAALTDVCQVNIIGAFIAAREAVRRMSTRHGGHGGRIINVSSGASVLGAPNTWIHYAATKGAMDTMTIGLSKEVARDGIRVNAVRPGIIDTELHDQRPKNQLSQIVSGIPMGRMGTAAEIAETVIWLASPAASYVTGCMLDARGGL